MAAPALAAETVTLDQGTLAGASDNGVDVYKAIPYAAPPVGDLRWQGAAARTALDRHPATRPPSALPARSIRPRRSSSAPIFRRARIASTLNVWTPAPRSGKLPVMLWIHGGGFIEGAASVPRFNGAALARRGVVLVTINYRLGRLGFFAYPGLSR